jgi:hypothetical protein
MEVMAVRKEIIYQCEICECYHPWDWNGDCRDNANRYDSPEQYAETNLIDARALELRPGRLR